MGVRINMLIDHDLADFRDVGEVLARLHAASGAARSLEEFWRATEPDHLPDPLRSWEADPENPRRPGLRTFNGPGRLFLTVTAAAMQVRCGGRWRALVADEPLRRAHLDAFRSIARGLGAGFLALHADSDDVDELLRDGRPAWECVLRMESLWGPPERGVEWLDAEPGEGGATWLPSHAWFLEDVQGGP
ncbi:hypothetical protein [Paludisphaera soli]|uniref:hypothetical protein n=1 Tax=Paludisphaera soli TaxID=2712865 RepID=UPI0013EAB17C|nr:hypothetical protein [Paludisphaera soli]